MGDLDCGRGQRPERECSRDAGAPELKALPATVSYLIVARCTTALHGIAAQPTHLGMLTGAKKGAALISHRLQVRIVGHPAVTVPGIPAAADPGLQCSCSHVLLSLFRVEPMIAGHPWSMAQMGSRIIQQLCKHRQSLYNYSPATT